MKFKSIHHVAIICSDYERSKRFYSELLGFEIVSEIHRKERQSWKCDLKIDDRSQIELFSFPNPPKRLSYPEACGLRHLAFAVDDVTQAREALQGKGMEVQEIRFDDSTSKRFFFFNDPDGLPIEIYQI